MATKQQKPMTPDREYHEGNCDITPGMELAAEAFGISERGAIHVGYFADLIVFDELDIADKSTFDKPEELATGMKYVIVNGRVAVKDGRPTRILAGRALRQPTIITGSH